MYLAQSEVHSGTPRFWGYAIIFKLWLAMCALRAYICWQGGYPLTFGQARGAPPVL